MGGRPQSRRHRQPNKEESMREWTKRAPLAMGAMVGALLLAGAAQAQPAGSYQQSCQNIRYQDQRGPNGVLTADCADRNGRWVRTSLETGTCRGDIFNRDGRLACAASGSSVDRGGIPGGSYQQSCQNVRYTDQRGPRARLTADCADRSGRFQRTSIDPRNCRGDIYNRDGRLDCAESGRAWRGQRGDQAYYRGSYITLFDNAGLGGTSRSFDGAIENLSQLGFNDRAGSVEVHGGGSWELCDDSGFRGRCVTVRGRVNLAQAGLENRVSSIRPVN